MAPARPNRVRVPELALGLVLVAGGALGALLWYTSVTTESTVVVAARDLPRGHVLQAGDLRAATVSGSPGVALLAGEHAHVMLGRTLLADVPASAALLPSMAIERDRPAAGEGLVSLALPAGHAPAELAALDVVRVVVVSRDLLGVASEPELVEHLAEVWSVTPPSEFDPTTLVTLRAPLELSTAVAAAEHVRLVVVEPTPAPDESTTDAGS